VHSVRRLIVQYDERLLGGTAALVLRIVPQCRCKVVDVAELSQWKCLTENFSFYAASDAAIWILVAFTVDRFVAIVVVSFPLQKRRICVRRNAIRANCVVLSEGE